MKQIIALFLLMGLSAPAFSDILPAGTPIQVALDKEVDHDAVKNGQSISAHIVIPVRHNGDIVLPAGSQVKGVVSQRENNFIFGVPGAIELTGFKIATPDGSFTPLTGTYQRKGNSRIAISLVGAYFIFFPPVH